MPPNDAISGVAALETFSLLYSPSTYYPAVDLSLFLVLVSLAAQLRDSKQNQRISTRG